MKALCWMGSSKVEVHNVSDPTILNPHDAIIKITRTAICGSDLHLYRRLHPNDGRRRHSRDTNSWGLSRKQEKV